MFTSGCSAPGPGGWDWGAAGPGCGAAGPAWAAPGLIDSEALIAVELCFIKGEGDSEDLRIANISFNNLDIIANQETIVELIGFAQRVAGGRPPKKVPSDTHLSQHNIDDQTLPTATTNDEIKRSVRTEITFDFHRLGVLLLRAAVHDGQPVARKIATAAVTGAKIQATLDASRVEVGGSLGGVQVVSLCEGAGVHTRVLAAGTLAHAQHDHSHHDKALFFTIRRRVHSADDENAPECAAVAVAVAVEVHVASVWYTHSGALLRELRSCLTEFKRYLANLARSIRAAAADMAITLVHPRGENLYSNPRLSQSTEGVSPRRRTVSVGTSLDDPPDLRPEQIQLSVNVELESPVVVVPRNAHSTQVAVAHLGRMSLTNTPGAPQHTIYRVRVRDISLATVAVAHLGRMSLTNTPGAPQHTTYRVRVRDISLATVAVAHLGRMSLTNTPGAPQHTTYRVRVRDISLATVSIHRYTTLHYTIQVAVAHLGRMSLTNTPGAPQHTTYRVRVRDISLATVAVAHLGRMSLTNTPGAPQHTTYRVRVRDISLATVSIHHYTTTTLHYTIQVAVAHLGRMSLTNTPGAPQHTTYRVRVRDISLATVSIHHYTTLHYTTLHYTTLPLHYTTLHYTTLHYTTLHYTTLHYTTLHYTTLHYTTLHYTTLHYTTLHYTTHYTTLHYTKLHHTGGGGAPGPHEPHQHARRPAAHHLPRARQGHLARHGQYPPLHYTTLHYTIQVAVAHLGRMSLTNTPGAPQHTTYRVRVRDISLATVSGGGAPGPHEPHQHARRPAAHHLPRARQGHLARHGQYPPLHYTTLHYTIQVAVAHLGRMSLTNTPGAPQHTTYRVRVRDISLATVSIHHYTTLHYTTLHHTGGGGAPGPHEPHQHARRPAAHHLPRARQGHLARHVQKNKSEKATIAVRPSKIFVTPLKESLLTRSLNISKMQREIKDCTVEFCEHMKEFEFGRAQLFCMNADVDSVFILFLDVAEKLKSHCLTAENLEQIYDVTCGQPVLHDTALQLSLHCSEGDQSGESVQQYEISGMVVGGLQVTARREQYEQVLETARWVTAPHPQPQPHHAPRAHPAQMSSGSSSSSLLEPAVPTLQLDPALRAATLATPPGPAPAPHHRHASPHQPATDRRHHKLIVQFEMSEMSVQLVADLGAGARCLVGLSCRELALAYRATAPHETHLQVSLGSVTMEDLTKEPGAEHRLLLVSQAARPRRSAALSHSCPRLAPPPAPHHPHHPHTAPHRPPRRTASLPAHLNVLDQTGRNRQNGECGATPPCSPECSAVGGGWDEADEGEGTDGEEDTDGEENSPAEHNLVLVSVHTRDPAHPHFEDTYEQIAKLTKVEFNSVDLVVNADSWVAVLDFFGIAGDDLPEDETPDPPPNDEKGFTSAFVPRPPAGAILCDDLY
ncbi:unnamed protein product [Diatraea saccharalis]|uniref:Uncharacterized protein n=1 Tax=Diatraea saccharalis TaxID=40085 RepID=A0A9P0C5Z9_9NEOP|nr:unnamed protein product [Diatraea saccharalis]